MVVPKFSSVHKDPFFDVYFPYAGLLLIIFIYSNLIISGSFMMTIVLFSNYHLNSLYALHVGP